MARRFTVVDVQDGESEAEALARAGGAEPEFQLEEKPADEVAELEELNTLDAESLNIAAESDALEREAEKARQELDAEADEAELMRRADEAAAAAIGEGRSEAEASVAAFEAAAPKKPKGARGRVGKKQLAEMATPATYSPRVEDERQVELEQVIQAKAVEPAKGPDAGPSWADAPKGEELEAEPSPLTPERLARAVEDVKRVEGAAVLALDQLHESPTNPRRTHPPLEGFLESVKRQGILQPLLVRPAPEGFEIIAGHRRFRAAQAAGLDTVPVIIRNLTDEQALEAQLVENLQRADVHPLEEAEAYERLMKLYGQNADTIAERLGKSRSFVYGRLKFLDLSEAARKAFIDGRLDASTALLVARIPTASLQEKALKELTSPGADGEAMSYRAAKAHVQSQYMLRLQDAPFNTKDAFLVEERGACGPCPDRTGNSPDLFGDVGRADVCTNIVCFQRKVSAHWANAKEKAGAQGKAILPAAEGKRLFASGQLPWNSPFVELNAIAPDDKEKRTWKRLLGKAQLPVTVAMDGQGHVRELVSKAQALSILAQEGVRWAQTAEATEVETEPLSEADVEAAKLDADIKALTVRNVMSAAVGHVEKKGLAELPVLRAMVMGLLHLSPPAFSMERRGFTTEDGLQSWVTRKADARQLQALAFELATAEWIGGGAATIQPSLIAIAKATGVDVRATEKGAKAELLKSRQAAAADALFSKAEMEAKAGDADQAPKGEPSEKAPAKVKAAAKAKAQPKGKEKGKAAPKAKLAAKAKAVAKRVVGKKVKTSGRR